MVVGATFPLEGAADAHRALESGAVVGKAVLVMEPSRLTPAAFGVSVDAPPPVGSVHPGGSGRSRGR